MAFRRNDLMQEQPPTGVVVFSGNGIYENQAEKAYSKGIPAQHGVRAGA